MRHVKDFKEYWALKIVTNVSLLEHTHVKSISIESFKKELEQAFDAGVNCSTVNTKKAMSAAEDLVNRIEDVFQDK